MSLQGEAFLDSYESAVRSIDDGVKAKAKTLDPMQRSFFVAEASAASKVFKTQLREKYKVEFEKVQAQAHEAQDRTNVSNAVNSLQDSESVKLFLQKGQIEQIARGINPVVAEEAVLTSFVSAALAQPNGRMQVSRLLEDGVLDSDAGTAKKIHDLLAADLHLQVTIANDFEKLDEAQAKQLWREKAEGIQKTMAGLSKDPVALAEFTIDAVRKASLSDWTGYEAKQIQAASDMYATEAEMSVDAKNFVTMAKYDNITPREFVRQADQMGLKINRNALTDFNTAFYAAEKPFIDDALRDWEDRAQGYMVQAAGLIGEGADVAYLMAAPEGKQLLAELKTVAMDAARIAYRDKGAPGVKAAIEDSLQALKDPAFLDTKARKLTLDQLSTVPKAVSPIKAFAGYMASGTTTPDNLEVPREVSLEDVQQFSYTLPRNGPGSPNIDDEYLNKLAKANPNVTPEELIVRVLAKHFRSAVPEGADFTSIYYKQEVLKQIEWFRRQLAYKKASTTKDTQ
jgi:hypothetical protein